MPDHGPRTAVGTAADRLRIENVLKLTQRIGDAGTYRTRGIAGYWCPVAEALNPAHTPPPMAFNNQKKQVLLGLESGRKLHELMREPGMPRKDLLEEWRTNDPEFDHAYQLAEEKGRVHRGEKPLAPKLRPAPVVVDEAGRERPIPRSSALQREAPARPGPALAPAGPPTATSDESPPRAEPAVADKDEQLKAEMLRRRRAGEKTTDLLGQVAGFNGNKLAAWRKADPEFAAAWDACRRPVGGEPSPAVAPRPAATGAAAAESLQRHVTGLEEQVNQLTARCEDLIASGRTCQQRVQALDEENNRLLAEAAQARELADERLGEALKWQEEFEREAREHDATRAARQQPAPLADAVVGQSAPRHPGLLLAEVLRAAGTNRTQLAAALGIKAKTLKNILGGQASLTLPLCAKLEALCIGTVEIWSRRQADYHVHHKPQPVA